MAAETMGGTRHGQGVGENSVAREKSEAGEFHRRSNIARGWRAYHRTAVFGESREDHGRENAGAVNAKRLFLRANVELSEVGNQKHRNRREGEISRRRDDSGRKESVKRCDR